MQHRFQPNVDNTARRSRIGWSHLIDEDTPLPTSEEDVADGEVGAFEGAGYCENGWFRPEQTCLMRSSSSTMCDVCRAEMESVMRGL
jgi:hypothetical protein